MSKKGSLRRTRKPPKHFVIDVDGVLTDGLYYYTADGKAMKAFGPNDHDALQILKQYIDIRFITGDKRGLPITSKRVVEDMKFALDLVSTFERVAWIERHVGLDQTIYMGDGLFDGLVFDKVAYSIAPANAFYLTKRRADFVTRSKGGDSAVAEACLHVMEQFFEPFDPARTPFEEVGIWRRDAPQEQ